ncbi:MULTISPECIES: hypothetical protein [unclassified Nocardiopsis]|uniref:hypothetical protein n=1 Tax=Nocardiopsis TaxID=2013 RepID=UPI00387AF922
MTIARTLHDLAARLERQDTTIGHPGSSIWGELSIIAYRTVSQPAVHAIEAAHPDWKTWTREEATAAIRALADTPDVEDARLAAAEQAWEDARWALAEALGVKDPSASAYDLTHMIREVAERIDRARREGARENTAPEPPAPAPPPLPATPDRPVVDVPLPGMHDLTA